MERKKYFRTLSIAGFDGSGGAGIQADLKTFTVLGCYGMTVLTALPVQNTLGVKSIYPIQDSCIEEQLRAIFDDIGADAVKIGMLHRKEVIHIVADTLEKYQPLKVILDPVMVAKSGDKLLTDEAIETMKKRLFPLTTLLTPNLQEASVLLRREILTKPEMAKASLDLVYLGPQAVVVKGGHLLQGDCDDCLCLHREIPEYHWFSSPRIQTKNTHGTGCTFSAAIAAFAAQGFDIVECVEKAKKYLSGCIEQGSQYEIGRGNGPVHHFIS